MKEANTKYLLDTSAIFCLRDKDPGFNKVKEILEKAQNNHVQAMASFMSFMEFYYIVYSRIGAEKAQEAYEELTLLPIKVIESNEDLRLLAGELKAKYSISLADAWIAATALAEEAFLVHKDPEFEALHHFIKCVILPYK